MNFKAQPSAGGQLCLSGTLSIEVCEELRSALAEYAAQAARLELDLSEVESADACALQLLIAAEKSAISEGKPFALTAVPEPVRSVSQELGLRLAGAAA